MPGWKRLGIAAAVCGALLAALPGAGSGAPGPASRILFVRVFGQYQLFGFHADGTRFQVGKDLSSRRDPALSPDDTEIAYTRLVDGSWGLWVSSADGSNAKELVANLGGWDGSPAWSPDGASIAYGTERTAIDYAIYTIPRGGGTPTRITPTGEIAARPAWSPDGTTLAYQIWQDQNWHVATIQLDGTHETRLTTESTFDGGPAWSPDGTQIAYEHDTGTATQIWDMTADGAGQHAVTHESSGTDQDPSFSSDGTAIVYSRAKPGGRSALWAVSLNSGLSLPFAGPTVRGADLVDPSVSRDGQIVFAGTDAMVREIFSVAPDGTGLRQLTHDGSWDALPTWSPDRRSVYFDAVRNGHDHLWRMRADGTGESPLGPQSGDEVPLRVSPDGKHILVISDQGGTPQPFVIGADGSGRHWLLRRPLPGFGSGSWSPDGQRLVISARAGIYVVNADGSGLERLPWSVKGDADPMWSPTGDSIVFTSSRSGKKEVWTAQISGKHARRLTHGAGAPSMPVWSPDGKSIAYTRQESKDMAQIWVMSASGMHARAVPLNPDDPDAVSAWA